jgi:O-antigen ligase
MSKIVARRPLSAICYTLYAISYLLFAACYFALALTYSRSSYLAYLVGISVVAWIKKSPKLFLAAFLLGVLTILILPRPSGSEGVRLEREESAWARVDNWKQSLTIWVKHPVFGVGFNTYRYAQKKERFLEDDWQENHAGAGADSSLLFVLATTGLLGFLSYGFLGWQMLKLKSLVVKASLIALLIHSFFLNSLFYPWVMLWFWSLDALGENQGE